MAGWDGPGEACDDAHPHLEPPRMTLTPGLTLLGLLLVLVAIPLAFSVAPLVIGVILLVFAVRRANEGLAAPA